MCFDQLLERQLAVVEQGDQRRLQTSLRLCGGMFVAMPTAIPDAPLTSRFGNCAGRTIGSSVGRGVVRPEVDRLLAELAQQRPAAIGVRRHSVYRIAAGGSPSIEPKLP